jgi:hypothetical protein
MTYSQLVDKLKARFGTAGRREKFAAELRARRRKRNESIPELYHDVRRLLALAYPKHGSSELSEIVGRDHFLRALDDVELELKIRDREPTYLDAAFKIAMLIEARFKSMDTEYRLVKPRRAHDEEKFSR